jgi:cholesterol oxidase
MQQLSQPIGRLKSHYEVVVVGSGYGGAIAASRLARAGWQVCLLERGREIAVGEFPATAWRGFWELQYNTQIGRKGSPLGLFEIHVNEDVNAVVGCALGGTSLINAGVALEPDERVWKDPRWPMEIVADFASVKDGYSRAREMLQPTRLPDEFGALQKLTALHLSARELGLAKTYSRPPINVTFNDGINPAGVYQKACNACGDCMSGCNVSAKNTTMMNYLPDAVNHGAFIFTQVEVRSVERVQDKWLLRYHLVGVGRELFAAPKLFLTADMVIIAAGTIGSTAILLRSKDRGLAISDAVGRRFSGNGDVLAFAYNTNRPIHGVGFGTRRRGRVPDVGPCITGIIDHRDTSELRAGFVIEEGSLPGAIGILLPVILSAASALVGQSVGSGNWLKRRFNQLKQRFKWLKQRFRIAKSFLMGPYRGAVRNTQTYLVMAHDNEDGRITLDSEHQPRISWPRAGYEHIYEIINSTLYRATKALGGDFVQDPLWSKLLGRRLVTVHPLGGCCMGANAETAVVDHLGRPFCGDTGHEVHKTLHLADGSIVPVSLGVNPLLTISALAERCCALIAKGHGREIDYTVKSNNEAQDSQASPPVGLHFTETMRGLFLGGSNRRDHAGAETSGKQIGMAFTLTITTDNLQRMLNDETHSAAMLGTLTCEALSHRPMTITEGTFNLFVKDPKDPTVRYMLYRGILRTASGESFGFDGKKTITRGSPLNAWKQTTTLNATVSRRNHENATVIGHAELHIAFGDFLRQLITFKATNATTIFARLAALVSFGKFFAGVLLVEYGGVFSRRKQ